MRVLYLNNDGGGFADYVEVAQGATVESFFAGRLPNRSPGDYLIRVNRQPAAADQVLQDGDRVTITPTKIEGAVLDRLRHPKLIRRRLRLSHRRRYAGRR